MPPAQVDVRDFFLLFFSPFCFGAQESVPSEAISVAFSLRKVGQETGTGRLDGNQERELRGLFSATPLPPRELQIAGEAVERSE